MIRPFLGRHPAFSSQSVMQFRRSGQRDYRRRRVLNEIRFGRSALWSDRPDGWTRYGSDLLARRSAHYGDAEFMDEQCRLTDLVPMRLGSYLLILIVGAGIIAGLEGLYHIMPLLAPLTSDGRVAAFDLDGEGSLAVWFSSMTLALAALSAMLVYSVRRHRRDDYHGRYRVWVWAALAFLLMSLDETASLHEGFKEMMTWLTGNRVFGDGSIWWVAAYFFALGVIGTRLVADMRECGLSTLAMLAVALCYVIAVAAQLGLILPESGARGVMLEEGAEMLGNLLLVLAMLLHARHVVLDAEGFLPARGADRDADGYVYDAGDGGWSALDGGDILVHPPRSSRAPARAIVAPLPVVEEITAPLSRKLTKQEKKALRFRLEQERRRREER